MPDNTEQDDADQGEAKGGEKPLSKSLLGETDSGGLAGQGGMIDPALDEDDDEPAED